MFTWFMPFELIIIIIFFFLIYLVFPLKGIINKNNNNKRTSEKNWVDSEIDCEKNMSSMDCVIRLLNNCKMHYLNLSSDEPHWSYSINEFEVRVLEPEKKPSASWNLFWHQIWAFQFQILTRWMQLLVLWMQILILWMQL